MATSGIQEHNEGCRKQRVLDRAAWARRMMLADNHEELTGRDPTNHRPPQDPEAPGYMRKMGSPPGITSNPYAHEVQRKRGMLDLAGNHSPTAIDRTAPAGTPSDSSRHAPSLAPAGSKRLRRDNVRAQQLITYSAKLPDRLTSVNFQQQW